MITNNAAYEQQVDPRVRNRVQGVSTLIICSNPLLRSGIGSILSGTQFILLDREDGDAYEPALILVAGAGSSDEYAVMVGQLKAQHPSARIVILTDAIEPRDVFQLFQAGVTGLCLTTMESHVLLNALTLVTLGEIFLPADISKALLGEAAVVQAEHRSDATALSKKLSERETQILCHLTEGAANKVIARHLGVAEATVKVHIKAILRKINAGNRTQAAMWAQRNLGAASGKTSPLP